MVIPCAYQAVRPRGHGLFEATVDPDLTLLLDREGNTVFEMERSDDHIVVMRWDDLVSRAVEQAELVVALEYRVIPLAVWTGKSA